MCGRYTLEDVDGLQERYDVELPADLKPNYNVAPTQTMPVITETADGKQLELIRWGFVPIWAKAPNAKYSMFNTVSETVFDKPTWKQAITTSRCLIPASAFYEWQTREGGKHPLYIHLPGATYLSLAGVWGKWFDDGVERHAFSILTTAPNKEMELVHNRMPVILLPGDEAGWLNPDLSEAQDIERFLRPLADDSLAMHEVSTEVNSVKSNDRSLILPLGSK